MRGLFIVWELGGYEFSGFMCRIVGFEKGGGREGRWGIGDARCEM